MNHWTQESTKDFAYHLSLDFFTQIQDRFDESEMLRKEFAEQLNLSPGRISQIFNDPPANPKIDSLVRYAQALGLKVSIVAYDDDDPTNDKGPVFSGVIAKCWEKMGKPRDLISLDVHRPIQIPTHLSVTARQEFYRPTIIRRPFDAMIHAEAALSQTLFPHGGKNISQEKIHVS